MDGTTGAGLDGQLTTARRNVGLLAVAQAILGSAPPLAFAVGGLAGFQMLGADKSLSTAPLTGFNIGVAVGAKVGVYTAHDSAYEAAIDLKKAGISVPVIVDAREKPGEGVLAQARALGIDSQMLGNTLQTLLTGVVVTQYRDRAESIDVVARAVPNERLSLEGLGLNDQTYLQLNVYNLTDSFYVGGFGGGLVQSNTFNRTTGVSSYGSPGFVQIGAPRTVSGTVVFKF